MFLEVKMIQYELGLTNSDRPEENYYFVSPKGLKLFLDISERGKFAQEFLDELHGYINKETVQLMD